MSKKSKRTTILVIALAMLILIKGMVSCSIRLKKLEKPSPNEWSEDFSDTEDSNHTPDSNPWIISENGDDSPKIVGESSPTPTDHPDRMPIEDPSKKSPVPSSTKPAKPSRPVEPAKPTVPSKPSEPVKPTSPPKPTKPPEPTKPVEPAKPVEPNKPDEPTKPVEPTKPPTNPGGGSGGGSVSYPPAAVEIIIPEFSHSDTEFEVKTVLRNVKSLEWAITENGANTPEKDFLKGALNKDGGKITISKPGEYILTATAKNYGNSTYTFTKTVRIHSTLEIDVNTDQYSHTDKEFEIKTSLSDNVTQQLNWHIYKDDTELKWSDVVTGTLSNTGGIIQLKDAGNYTLRAVAYDETSRVFSGQSDIIVLPVVEISLQSTSASHTDTPAAISVITKELGSLNIVWSAVHEGKEVPLADLAEATLSNEGGSILFKEKGNYSIVATVTDLSGRTFSSESDLKIYPVADFSFTLPSIAHTDTAIDVEVKSSELQDMKAEWSVLLDGKAINLEEALNGKLDNEGGSIRFKQKGRYILKSTLVDTLGREYSYEASTIVYPVAETGFYLPAMTHTDTTVEVKTFFKEIDGLSAEWSLYKDGNSVNLEGSLEGTLTDTGGKIRFKEVGNYELEASVTDQTGRSFSYSVSSTVYPVITLSMELPKQTHTDKPVEVSLAGQNLGNLTVKWSAVKNNVAADVTEGLANLGGTLSITEKGPYVLSASVTDKAGRTFSTQKMITVYPIPQMVITLPSAAHTDDILMLDVETKDMEGLTAIWSVDNTFGFQDWDTYIDGTLRNNGGSIRFKRAGVYDLEASVTDATGRVFRFGSNKIEILPVLSLAFELPATGHTDTQIDVRTRGNNGVLPIEWTLMKNGETIPFTQAVNGSLNAQGGKIRFTAEGEYRLTATMFDALGRIFSASEKISVYPLYNCNFSMPNAIHTGQNFEVVLDSGAKLGGKSIVWTAEKDGKTISVSDSFKGTLSNTGGTVHIDATGSYNLTATIKDETGRTFTHTQSISVTNSAPTKPSLIADTTRSYLNGKFMVNLTASSTDPDGDIITYEYEGKAADDYYPLGTYTVKVRAKDPFGGVSEWTSVTFTVANSAPTQPAVGTTVHRYQYKDGKFLVTITPYSTDPDGDPITFEYQNKADDNYYPFGTHTIKVRAKDSYGGISEWTQARFTVENSPPTRPEITRTPGGNSVVPGTPVTITANSTDPDRDPITYIWEGRGAETSTYPLGKNTVRVKAVDRYGAESPWAAIVFFVMDPNGSGGMMLTGPESVILENGVEGATITKWTFNVPAVSGHVANYDYGEVKGYNKLTKQWERLTNVSFNASIGSSFAATDGNTGRVYSNNGVYMSGTLNPGVYTKLQFYYYTPHNCMYNKSNITYTVEYYFE